MECICYEIQHEQLQNPSTSGTFPVSELDCSANLYQVVHIFIVMQLTCLPARIAHNFQGSDLPGELLITGSSQLLDAGLSAKV